MHDTISITLAWPNKALSPNGRPKHWSIKHKAVKLARRDAWAAVLEQNGATPPDWEKVALRWVFHPKTRNAVDRDNLIASVKAYQDGIADALGIDDQHFHSDYEIGEPVKGGLVKVTIGERK